MAVGVFALTYDGNITRCKALPEDRGKGRCKHILHQLPDESDESFIKRAEEYANSINSDPDFKYEQKEIKGISQEEINSMAKEIDEIAGQHVTIDNFKSVLSELTPDQIDKISKIAFNAAPNFSLPITDENYNDEEAKNRLYFANLPAYGIGGNAASIDQMFNKVGTSPVIGGTKEVDHSYMEGLTPGEYFIRQFSARDALISKGVGTAKPGYTARKLFYAMSDIMVIDDCGGEHIDALHCKMPEGHICLKCAHATHGGEHIKISDHIGGLISTNISEALTQLSMNQMHVGTVENKGKQHGSEIIRTTLDGWGTSPIIQAMRKANSTEERRKILFEGLKDQYKEANIKQDDFNLQMVARKLTSYKRDENGLRPVNDNEVCDIATLVSIGNRNNIFKVSELQTGYKAFTTPGEQEIKPDSVNDILR